MRIAAKQDIPEANRRLQKWTKNADYSISHGDNSVIVLGEGDDITRFVRSESVWYVQHCWVGSSRREACSANSADTTQDAEAWVNGALPMIKAAIDWIVANGKGKPIDPTRWRFKDPLIADKLREVLASWGLEPRQVTSENKTYSELTYEEWVARKL